MMTDIEKLYIAKRHVGQAIKNLQQAQKLLPEGSISFFVSCALNEANTAKDLVTKEQDNAKKK